MEFKKIQLNGFKSFAEKTNFLIDQVGSSPTKAEVSSISLSFSEAPFISLPLSSNINKKNNTP